MIQRFETSLLNPDESIPMNSCPIFVRIMNDEIIFSSRVPLAL